MIEYSVMLKRFAGSSRPDVCIFRDEDRGKALAEMRKYVRKNGFTVHDSDGTFTIRTVSLVEKEPVAGAPVISEKAYHELFNTITDELL
jgi:hypothetical protein